MTISCGYILIHTGYIHVKSTIIVIVVIIIIIIVVISIIIIVVVTVNWNEHPQALQ